MTMSGKRAAHPGGEVAVAAGHSDVLRDLDGLHRDHLAPLVHLLQQLVQPARADTGQVFAAWKPSSGGRPFKPDTMQGLQ